MTVLAARSRGGSGTLDAVQLSGVTKRFDDVVAVEAMDLHVRQGEFFSLLGPSGCGKTTTLRMIAGLEFPTQGSLRIHGVEMGLLPPNKRPVNTVFQSYALFPHMDVETNIGFGPPDAQGPQGGTPSPRPSGHRAGQARGPRPAQASAAVRRPAAAGWRWPGLSSTSRRSCCSTNRWVLSTSSSDRTCRASSRACSVRSASRSCT